MLLRVPVVAKTLGFSASGSMPNPMQFDEDKITASHSFLHSVVSLGTRQGDITQNMNAKDNE